MEYDRSKEIFAFYNVENLLLPDAPPVHSADPTISGLRNWDDRKYRQKLNKIAHVAELISASEGVLPMLFGVAEIQGEKALTDVLELPFFKAFRAVHFPSADKRGIDVALLYDPEKVEILSSKTIRLTEESGQVFDTRDILHVRLGFCNEIFNAYVLHFPSRKDKDANFGLRENLVRRLAADIAQNSNSEAVILMGDFNCNPDDKMLLPIFENNSGKQIFNPFADLYTNGIYSTFHNKSGQTFDQIMLSEHFQQSDFPLKFTAAKVFSHEKLRSSNRKLAQRPARTYAGKRYLGGYSDHFPVITVLN